MTPSFENEVVVVTGLRREARIARQRNVSVVVSGASAARAAQLLENGHFEHATAIYSFGLAGGLNPNYQTGDIVIPHTIKVGTRALPTDTALASEIISQLLRRGISARQGILVGVDHVVRTPEEKQALRAISFADSVDIESGAAALYAAAHGIRFIAVRVISDPSTRALPVASANAITATGWINPFPVIESLIRDPRQYPEVRQAGRDAAEAFASLSQCRDLLL